jgi:hypothetical protein
LLQVLVATYVAPKAIRRDLRRPYKA